MVDNWNIPLYNSIMKYSESKPTPFHMPGHKLGKGLPSDYIKNLAAIDITEIPGFDNLHHPQGIIKEAQDLAALAFGADKTFFLVNGSTGGIHAIIMTVCKPGDKLILARDCHKSVINGMILAGVKPVYINPEFNKTFGITTVVSAEEIEKTILQNPEAVGVLITRPSYYGICSDVAKIAETVHLHGKVLIVDEAHGAHLKFSSRLPDSAMQSGSDICVQSAHKTLSAFTQSAYLHVKSNNIDMDRLKFNLSLLQTSSPSYIFMSTLDVARAVMQYSGEELIGRLLDNIEQFKAGITKPENLKLLLKEDIGNANLDHTRIVIKTRGMSKTGYEVEKILRDKYNIQVEMSDLYNIVCIATIADREEDFAKLSSSLLELSAKFKDITPLADIINRNIEIPVQAFELKDVRSYEGIKIELSRAVGKISLDMITPYPPGIPILCPGEIINMDMVEYVYDITASGGIVNGLTGNMEISVVK